MTLDLEQLTRRLDEVLVAAALAVPLERRPRLNLSGLDALDGTAFRHGAPGSYIRLTHHYVAEGPTPGRATGLAKFGVFSEAAAGENGLQDLVTLLSDAFALGTEYPTPGQAIVVERIDVTSGGTSNGRLYRGVSVHWRYGPRR